MINLEGPGGIQFRDVRYGDEEAILEICRDWRADGQRFTLARAHQAVHKYVLDMELEPGAHPCTADSTYREALISFAADGSPECLCVYVVRGASDPKNFPLPVHSLRTEVFSIAAAHRTPARARELLAVLMRSAFEVTGVEVLAHQLLDTATMRDHLTDREYSTEPVQRETPKGVRIDAAFTRADHEARMARVPTERDARQVFEISRDPTTRGA